MRTDRSFLLFSFIIAAAVFSLYSVSLGHNFLFDEENVILSNPVIKTLSLPAIFSHGLFYLSGDRRPEFAEYYRPLASLTFALDFRVWKANPMGYNLTSLLLHTATSVLFVQCLLRWVKNRWAALLAGLFYAVHTVHSEQLRDISCRGEILAGLFLLAAFLLYAKSRAGLAWVAFLPALLSKENSVLIPLYLTAYDLCFRKGRFVERFKRLFPFFLTAVLYVLFRKTLCPVPLVVPHEPIKNILLRVLSMGPALWEYLKALGWPAHFKFFGAVEYALSFRDPKVFLTLGVFVTCAALLLFSFKKNKTACFGLSVFLIGLVPFMQWVHFYPEWAEHFLYVPAMGFSILLADVLDRALSARKRVVAWAILAVYAAWLVFIGVRTYERNKLTNDLEKFYTALSRSYSPYAVSGYHELARRRIREERYDEAILLLRQALANTRYNADVTYQMLGACYSKKGDWGSALENLKMALKFDDRNDRYRIDIGKMLVLMGRYEEAIAFYEQAQTNNPSYYLTYRLLLEANELAGKPQAALEWGEKGLEAVSGKKEESAALNMAILRLAYWNGWQEILESKLKTMARDYADVPWRGALAKLLAGQITPEDFTIKVLPQYTGFEEEAGVYILMSYVLQKKCEAARAYLAKNKETFDALAKQNLFFDKDLKRAKALCDHS